MAHLYIDGAVLARMRANLGRVEELLERPGRELAQLDDSSVGANALRARMAEFGDEWSYGIRQLGKFSGDAAAALAKIEADFAEVDARLSQALGGSGAVPHAGGVGAVGRSRGYGPGYCSPSPLRMAVLPALGFDPTPGDYAAVDGAVATLRNASRALSEIANVLRGSGDDAWRGQAATAFRELMDSELRPRVEKAAEAFGGAVGALEGWVWFMGDAQATTRRLERVVTSVVDVPPTPPEVDLGELLTRLLSTGFDPSTAYVESFRTEMGCGAGLITHNCVPAVNAFAAEGGTTAFAMQTALRALLPEAVADGPVLFGLAAAVTCSAAGGRGLLVMGVCMDPDQVLELAGVVALVAGRSRVRQDRHLQDEES